MALQVVDAVQLIASVPRALGMLVGLQADQASGHRAVYCCLAKLPAKTIVRVAKNVAERCRLYMVHVEHSHCRAERLLFWETLARHKGRPPRLKHLERLVRHVRASTGVSGLLARALAPPSQA